MTTTQQVVAPRVPASGIEALAQAWIEPYSQAWHLVRARDWLVYLVPEASLEMRMAAITHDIERMVPGGPSMNKATDRWDDPDYLYAHASRSAAVVGEWLGRQGSAGAAVDAAELRRLITLHEFGGLEGADAVQAADSLSFLETLRDVVREWVLSGECGVAKARRKHQYMHDRIRVAKALPVADQLLAEAMASLDDLEGRT